MMLSIVVPPPGLVGLLHLWPVACVGKGIVPKPSVDRDYVELILPLVVTSPQNLSLCGITKISEVNDEQWID